MASAAENGLRRFEIRGLKDGDSKGVEPGSKFHAFLVYGMIEDLAGVNSEEQRLQILDVAPQVGRITNVPDGRITQISIESPIVIVGQQDYRERGTKWEYGVYRLTDELVPPVRIGRNVIWPQRLSEVRIPGFHARVRRISALASAPGHIAEHFGTYDNFLDAISESGFLPKPGVVTDGMNDSPPVFGNIGQLQNLLPEFVERMRSTR